MTSYWPEGLPRHLDYPPVTLGDLNASAARLYGDRVALRDGEETLTFTELHEQACGIANGLRAAGVGDGDVVVLHLPNTLWFLPCYYGILLAGAVVSPTNPLQPAPGLRAQIQETRAVAGISHPDHASTLQEASAGTTLDTVVVVPGTAAAPASGAGSGAGTVTLADFVAGHPMTRPPTGTGPDDVAHLAYTGGTTGVPKAVRVLHRNVVANATQMTGWRAAHAVAADATGHCTLTRFPDAPEAGVVPGDALTIMVSPMFHAHALINANFLLTCGTTLVLLGRFSPTRMLELIESERATYITGSPTMWHALVGCPDASTRDLSSARVVSSGAAPIDLPTLQGLERIFPSATIVEGYGLTEGTALVSAQTVFRDGWRKEGSVGLPVFDTRVEIRSQAPGGPPLGAGVRGQLWVKGPQVTGGFLGRPEATAEQFVDGWLATADIAYVDEDGFLFICDRATDMLIYKGYNVYPRELEDLLGTHPDVDATAVVGREVTAVGQEPVAFVVPAAGTQVDPDQLMAYVAERVLPYKKVRAVHVVDRLPSNPAGKVLKRELRDRADSAALRRPQRRSSRERVPSMTSDQPPVTSPPGPLAGLQVVELSSFVAAPLCGTTLAQLGADVIRVEPMGGGPDRTRWPLTDGGSSLYWNSLNPGKRAIEVDLADPLGRRLVADLVASGGSSGGILVTNTERWHDLSFPALKDRRADVIHVLLTGRNDGGTAVDYTVQAGSGFPLVTGPGDHGTPVNHQLPAWDLAAGLYLATGLLAAERHRSATGRGSEVRVALEDVALATAGHLGYLAQAQLRPDASRVADGNFVYGTFGRDFTTVDGQRFMLVVLTPRQWADLLRVTGLGEAVDVLGRVLGADFSDEGDRYRHREVLAGLVAEWFARHDAAQVQESLASTRLLCSPYRSFDDLVADDARLLRANPLFGIVDQPGVGNLVAAGSPVEFDRGRAAPRPAPGVGEHTGRVLADELGLSRVQMADLTARGVVRAHAETPAEDVA